MYTPYTPPATTFPSHVPEVATRYGKNPIPRTVVKAILLGVVLQVVAFGLTRALHLQSPTAVALGLGLTISFYLLVLSLVQGRLFDSAVKPVWHIGPPGTALVIGITVGALQAAFVVLASSAVAGHVSSDASATMAFAQGGLVRIGALLIVMVVCAPFIEELLFRGLLAESMRPRGRGAAIWLSALAFALWHLRPDAIRYYLLCGALLGLLYWKRGLVCSMAAHATFNGMLVLVAALSLSGPAHPVTAAGVSLSAPASWRQVTATASPTDLELRNPSGAQMFVHRLAGGVSVDPAVLTSGMNAAPALGPGVTIKAGTVHAVQYPGGAGAAVTVDDNGHEADAVVLGSPQGSVLVELVTGGNPNAHAQFNAMLQSLQLA